MLKDLGQNRGENLAGTQIWKFLIAVLFKKDGRKKLGKFSQIFFNEWERSKPVEKRKSRLQILLHSCITRCEFTGNEYQCLSKNKYLLYNLKIFTISSKNKYLL